MSVELLLVEDDDGIAAPLERALSREGYEVHRVADGSAALERIEGDRPPSLVVLDLGLPDMDGLEVCLRARESGLTAPILILTARGDELDRVVGLDSGADDYMAKPVALAELLARVRALLRRIPDGGAATRPGAEPAGGAPGAPAGPVSTVGHLRVDEGAHRAFVGDDEVALSGKEFALLALLAREAGRVVTRERIMEEVWDEHWFGSTKTLDVTLGRLRAKVTPEAAGVQVTAVRGVGFRLEPSA